MLELKVGMEVNLLDIWDGSGEFHEIIESRCIYVDDDENGMPIIVEFEPISLDRNGVHVRIKDIY